MVVLKSLLAATLASTAWATKVIVPLYSWNEQCWPELQQAAAANPSQQFVLILNPDSGPTLDPTDPSMYCVPILRAKMPSSTIIGYVRTGYGSRSQSDISSEINQYKSWAGIKVNATSGATAKLDGIFFDEVSDSTSSTNLKRYQTYSSLARNAFGRTGSTVVFNPGTAVDARFFNWADLVMYYESAYADYSTSQLPKNAQLLAKSAIIIHSFPTGSAGSKQLPVTLKPLVPASGAVYITDLDINQVDVYSKFGPDWQEFVKDVAQLGGTKPSTGVQLPVVTPTTKVIVPLYSWSDKCWPELQEAAAANPSQQFVLIVNPNSGPTLDSTNPSLYCVPILRSKVPNSSIIGYVRTTYGDRASSDVAADIDQFKSWGGIKVNATTGATAKLDGIFFDEVSSSTNTTNLERYESFANLTRTAFGSSSSTVVFNPGTAVDARFFNWADLIMYYESAFADYSTSKLPQDAQLLRKSAIVVHSFPTGSAGSTQLPITLKPLVPASGAVYITDLDIKQVDVYSKFGGDWQEFVKDVAQLNGGTAATTTTTAAGTVNTLVTPPNARVTNGAGRMQKRMWRGE
ncbi:Spherulin-4 [Rhodotorula toruloides]|nr:Spherulin-4 [Rhodotorula toruloides]